VKHLPPLILLLSSAGCAQRDAAAETPWTPDPAPDLGAVVARVGSVPIYSAEVAAEAMRSQGTARDALNRLISLHVLAENAHRTERFSPDWSDAELRSALAERLLDREILPKTRREAVPEQELQGLYDKAIKAFVHPRLVEVGLLAVFTGPMMKPEPRREREKTAKALANDVAARRIHSAEAMEAMVRDPLWKDRSISYRKTVPWLDPAYSDKLNDEVLRLRAPGDTSPLIEDEVGYFIATYVSEKPAEKLPYSQVRESLLQRYYEHWRPQRLEQLVRSLSKGHQVEVHPQLLKVQ
jgi:hypothetical protein